MAFYGLYNFFRKIKCPGASCTKTNVTSKKKLLYSLEFLLFYDQSQCEKDKTLTDHKLETLRNEVYTRKNM